MRVDISGSGTCPGGTVLPAGGVEPARCGRAGFAGTQSWDGRWSRPRRWGRIVTILAATVGIVALAEPPRGAWSRGTDLAWQAAADKASLTPKYRAVVIGISDYAYRPPLGWENLTTARRDAEDVAKVLQDKYGFAVRCLLDGQATRGAIMEALDELVHCSLDDAVLVYFAGHGNYDEKLGEGFWIPHDARRKVGGKDPKEDWIWNSTLTTIFGASQARHILVVADSCYGGSLFRGGALSTVQADSTWYRRAIAVPSRYLITSGNLEPVVDSGIRHTVFCQSLLDYLTYTDKKIFAASELGLALREKVSTLTAQMPRMGPLAVASHVGGEFVFVAKNTPFPEAPVAVAAVPAGSTRGGAGEDDAPQPAGTPRDVQTALRDVALMEAQGATNSARAVLQGLMAAEPDNRLVRALAESLDGQRRERERAQVRALLEHARHGANAGRKGANDGVARPRVLAFPAPVTVGGGSAAEGQALLYGSALRAALDAEGGLVVVQREALQDLLQELQMGSSDLADPRARLAVGKLLPASLVLMLKFVPHDGGADLFWELADTETTRTLAFVATNVTTDANIGATCAAVARVTAAKAVVARPLVARVTQRSGTRLQAGVGQYQACREGMDFAVFRGAPNPRKPTDMAGGTAVGSARIVTLGEVESVLLAEWAEGGEPRRSDELWIRERTRGPGP